MSPTPEPREHRMNLEDLRRLAAGGESETVEFKKSTAQLPRAGERLYDFLNGAEGQALLLKGGQAKRRYGVNAPSFKEKGGTVVVTFNAPVRPGTPGKPGRDQVGTRAGPSSRFSRGAR